MIDVVLTALTELQNVGSDFGQAVQSKAAMVHTLLNIGVRFSKFQQDVS